MLLKRFPILFKSLLIPTHKLNNQKYNQRFVTDFKLQSFHIPMLTLEFFKNIKCVLSDNNSNMSIYCKVKQK